MYLRKEIEEVNKELHRIRLLKEEWKTEAISDKNPYIVDYYKRKTEDKEKDLSKLKKSMKKFAIIQK